MPRKKRGHGFSHPKSDRYHSRRGHSGRGNASISASSSDTMVGELRDDSPTPTLPTSEVLSINIDSEDSNATSVFQHALSATPTPDADLSLEVELQSASGKENLIQGTLSLIRAVLPSHWTVIRAESGFHVVQLSRGSDPAIQRNLYVTYSGTVRITVHRKPIAEMLVKEFMKDWFADIPLTPQSSRMFVDKILSVVLACRSYEVCAGADNIKYKELWGDDSLGAIDSNPYDESRYVNTFRSSNCALLVPIRHWRCEECKKAAARFGKKIKRHLCETVHPQTKNTYLDAKQKESKLSMKLKAAGRKLDYLERRVGALLEQNGVNIDEELGHELSDILRDAKMTPMQQLFLQQQHKSAMSKRPCGMRWHPAMIRFALSLKSTSSAAYSVIQSSGDIRLSSERVLFDYTHAVPRTEGLFTDKINLIGDHLCAVDEEYKKYHCLLMDEIHISQKLVYKKSDGSLVGYMKLNEVESELKLLADSIEEASADCQPEVATKILTYMIKGACNSTKEVVAAYPVANLTKEQLFDQTWEVISNCELQGVRIIAVVCDGSAVNRSFIAMHTPATRSECGIVFDTVNMCAPSRNLFFISDPPHLLKTIRNCFAKSGTGKKCSHLLTKNNEFIVWKTIERLFMEDMKLSLRRCHKLTSQSVYLNSYSCMKVAYAAHVLSNTVSQDLRDRKWPGTSETVNFILKCNNMFDCLNGAHSDQAIRTANIRLAPYTSVIDKRFDELREFGLYLKEWESEVLSLTGVSESEKQKRLLSRQTREGLSMTLNSFVAATTFLLNVGAKFVNARIFSQDPLEEYFGKQRSSGGGRQNPTVSSFIATDTQISIHRDTNVRLRSGNVEGVSIVMEVSDEPLQKRQKPSVS